MRLNLYSLQLFVAVVEEGTIAAAAEREHIATSALSKRISELERLIGTPLLIRQSRGVMPSEAGRTLARGARTLLHGAEDLAAEVRDFASGVTGHVRVAANLSSITQFLAHDIARFLAL
jgi:DNA-binding transcriptional LysR family regulator